ncbi:MAG: hypothetical protein HGA47_09005 [Zoogloea sp.]|nr:hypothetical protein [Zoogloea sp.]
MKMFRMANPAACVPPVERGTGWKTQDSAGSVKKILAKEQEGCYYAASLGVEQDKISDLHQSAEW